VIERSTDLVRNPHNPSSRSPGELLLLAVQDLDERDTVPPGNV
jgi:hypothetical protein